MNGPAPNLKALKQLRKEPELFKHIPFENHVTKHTIVTSANDYVQVIRLQGVSFETVDDVILNSLHKERNNLFRSLVSPNVAIWHHVIRRKENKYPDGEYPKGFAHDFTEKYMERIGNETLMVNELYLTIVYRPVVTKLGRTFASYLRKKDAALAREDHTAAMEELEHIASQVMVALDRYEPERLGVYQHNDQLFSEPLEFFAYLVNLQWSRIPLLHSAAKNYICYSRPFFGSETIEIRQPSASVFAAQLGYTAYPNETKVGFFDMLLTSQHAFVLTQSFTFLAKQSAKYVAKTSRNRMLNSGDDSISQLDELDVLLDNLESNTLVMGEHHISLLVHETTTKRLDKAIANLRSALADHGAIVAREDLALEAAFWASLPANFKYRPRLSPITSRNFAGMCSMHNYPTGRMENNHWGKAVTLLQTDANTPYYFNFHASNPGAGDDDSERKDVGHTIVLGPTGCGKTVFVAAMITFLQKYFPTTICFTKDRDLAILIQALGGTYRPLLSGAPTGCNPFQLEPTKENIQFWNDLVAALITRPLKPKDLEQIKEAINWMTSSGRIPLEARRLGRLLDHLDKQDPDGVHHYIRQWCYSTRPGDQDGLYAWVLDNPADEIAGLIASASTHGLIGFDMTHYIDNPAIRGPLNMYLFHLVNQVTDGRRLGIFVAEFWKAIGDEMFAKFAKDSLKTIRKKNGFVCLDSQSPQDALNHEIAATLIEQTATKILFPNIEAKYEDYVNGLSLSDREYSMIQELMGDGSRKFLIKQGQNSVVAKLDLAGFDFELDVLSGTESNIRIVEQLINEHGPDPETWLPLFQESRRKTGKRGA